MTQRIVVGADGRKYITNEPQLHSDAAVLAAVAEERERNEKAFCEIHADYVQEAAERDAEIERLRKALLTCARQAEALKRDCGMDPESAQALRNSQYQAISTTAHIALGTIKGAADAN